MMNREKESFELDIRQDDREDYNAELDPIELLMKKQREELQ